MLVFDIVVALGLFLALVTFALLWIDSKNGKKQAKKSKLKKVR